MTKRQNRFSRLRIFKRPPSPGVARHSPPPLGRRIRRIDRRSVRLPYRPSPRRTGAGCGAERDAREPPAFVGAHQLGVVDARRPDCPIVGAVAGTSACHRACAASPSTTTSPFTARWKPNGPNSQAGGDRRAPANGAPLDLPQAVRGEEVGERLRIRARIREAAIGRPAVERLQPADLLEVPRAPGSGIRRLGRARPSPPPPCEIWSALPYDDSRCTLAFSCRRTRSGSTPARCGSSSRASRLGFHHVGVLDHVVGADRGTYGERITFPTTRPR